MPPSSYMFAGKELTDITYITMFQCCRGTDSRYVDEEWLQRNSSLSAVELLRLLPEIAAGESKVIAARAAAKEVADGGNDADAPRPLRLQTLAIMSSALLGVQKDVRSKKPRVFTSAKFKEARQLLLEELSAGDVEELEAAGAALQAVLEDVRLLLVVLLFNRDYWHPDMAGGGLHTFWNLYSDDFDGKMPDGDGIDCPASIFTTGVTWVPGYDGIPYETLRSEIIDAWIPVQEAANELSKVVQRFADHFYGILDGTPPQIQPIKAETFQTVPEEFVGREYHHFHDEKDPESAALVLEEICNANALLVKAQSMSPQKSQALLPGVAPVTFPRLQRLINVTPCAPKRHCYFSFLIAKHLNVCKRFDKYVAAVLQKAGAIPKKAPFKSIDRIKAKVQSEYKDGPAPGLHRVTDILRMSATVQDHQSLQNAVDALRKRFPFIKLKPRLDGPTHDILAVFSFDGILAEVQFSFYKVNLMKVFSHASYDYSRINLKASDAMEAILTAAFVGLPRDGPFYTGGYESMTADQIKLKAVLL